MDTARTGRYIPVCLLIGTPTARYRAYHRLGLFLPHYHPKSAGSFNRRRKKKREKKTREKKREKKRENLELALLSRSLGPCDPSLVSDFGRRNKVMSSSFLISL
ncbi:hypothetical protein GW17_00033622 [Ensete ventricosum]|nr:hypothetical protein GW17_00033622 [Ensete ventricosum]